MSMTSVSIYQTHGYLSHKTGSRIHALTEPQCSRFASTSISRQSSQLAYSGFKKSYEQEAQLK
jgi:hypothetical protein